MTKRYIYDTIVSLTAEIQTTDIGLKLFEAAKLDGRKVKEVSETFMSEYPELYQKMCSFATELNKLVEESKTGTEAEIFGFEEDEENGIHVFDPEVVDVPSFFVLTFLTNIDGMDLFEDKISTLEGKFHCVIADSKYLDAIEEESGSHNLANFLANDSLFEEVLDWLKEDGYEYSNIYDLLADVFAGGLSDWK